MSALFAYNVTSNVGIRQYMAEEKLHAAEQARDGFPDETIWDVQPAEYVAVAVVYGVPIAPGETEPQVETWERFTDTLPEAPPASILFATGVLHCEARHVHDPDFDVDVRAHGEELEPVAFP